MNLAFVFSMENPNNYKVMLDDMKFTVSFEEFRSQHHHTSTMIITFQAKSTDHLRINGSFDSYDDHVALLVTQGAPVAGIKMLRPLIDR